MLDGKIALVTGAGSGVGRATALALGREGASLALIGRREVPLRETAEAIASSGGHAIAVPADIRDESSVRDAVATVTSRFGGIDIVVHAAAVGLYGPVQNYTLAQWRETIDTNLTGLFLICREALPHLKVSSGGAIVAIGSGAGKQGYATLSAYSASKFGVLGFMESLAAEVTPLGIKVSTINPGSIMTGFGGRPVDEKERQRAEGRKYLDPDDVARAILFLLTQPAGAWTQEMNLWPV